MASSSRWPTAAAGRRWSITSSPCGPAAGRWWSGWTSRSPSRRGSCADLGSTTVDELWSLVGREGEGWLAECCRALLGAAGTSEARARRPTCGGPSGRSRWGASAPRACSRSAAPARSGPARFAACPTCAGCATRGSRSGPSMSPPPGWCSRSTPACSPGRSTRAAGHRRADYLAAAPWSVAPPFAASIIDSEDAFDAAISALVMHDHGADLAALRRATDPVGLLEGDVWRPPKIAP